VKKEINEFTILNILKYFLRFIVSHLIKNSVFIFIGLVLVILLKIIYDKKNNKQILIKKKFENINNVCSKSLNIIKRILTINIFFLINICIPYIIYKRYIEDGKLVPIIEYCMPNILTFFARIHILYEKRNLVEGFNTELVRITRGLILASLGNLRHSSINNENNINDSKNVNDSDYRNDLNDVIEDPNYDKKILVPMGFVHNYEFWKHFNNFEESILNNYNYASEIINSFIIDQFSWHLDIIKIKRILLLFLSIILICYNLINFFKNLKKKNINIIKIIDKEENNIIKDNKEINFIRSSIKNNKILLLLFYFFKFILPFPFSLVLRMGEFSLISLMKVIIKSVTIYPFYSKNEFFIKLMGGFFILFPFYKSLILNVDFYEIINSEIIILILIFLYITLIRFLFSLISEVYKLNK